MKVSSKKTLRFPSFGWGIRAGESKELPAGEEARKAILAHSAISEVGGGTKVEATQVDTTINKNNDEK